MIHIVQASDLENKGPLRILGGASFSGTNNLVYIIADVFEQGLHLFLFLVCERIAIFEGHGEYVSDDEWCDTEHPEMCEHHGHEPSCCCLRADIPIAYSEGCHSSPVQAVDHATPFYPTE